MLDYLILVVRTVLMAAVTCGVIAGYTKLVGNKVQKNTVLIFAIAGTIISMVIAYFRNATSKLDSAVSSGIIYTITLVSFMFFVVFVIINKFLKNNKVLNTISWVFLGMFIMAVLAYNLSDVWAYPYHILLSESTIISTDFLLGLIGVILGLILMIVTYFAVERSEKSLNTKPAFVMLVLMLLLNVIVRCAGLFSVLFQKRIVKSNQLMFSYTVFVKNNGDMFIYISLGVVVLLSIVLWIMSFKQKEPYNNPAQHRKIRAKWKKIRYWATTVIVCCILGVCTLTVIEKYNETDVTLSPIEPATKQDDENVYVSFDLVSDGHLHRFAYETENGVEIRFIIIKKPKSSAYGIGLDACDVCGETGYYERDGQVVCNLCDVVMNISTIGFKGGCNPIVIPYEIKDGQIIVPISGLMEYESEFK